MMRPAEEMQDSVRSRAIGANYLGGYDIGEHEISAQNQGGPEPGGAVGAPGRADFAFYLPTQ
jgi:hypothetical protein